MWSPSAIAEKLTAVASSVTNKSESRTRPQKPKTEENKELVVDLVSINFRWKQLKNVGFPLKTMLRNKLVCVLGLLVLCGSLNFFDFLDSDKFHLLTQSFKKTSTQHLRSMNSTCPHILASSKCKETMSSKYAEYKPENGDSPIDFSEFLKGAIHTSTPICRLNNTSEHFPHSMQDLYSCISWWQYQETSKDSTQAPILSISDAARYKLSRGKNRFTKSLLETLKPIYNITVRVEEELPINHNNYVEPIESGPMFGKSTKPAYNSQSPSQLQTFRQDVVDYLFPNKTKSSCESSHPRIGILNRWSTRSLDNIDPLVEALKQEFPNSSVRAAYFESAPLSRQIQFFSSVDILISPHGAQLTGLPFLPQCASLIEVFPKRYFAPEFYGSLAHAAGIQYGYLYLSSRDPVEEMELSKNNFQLREQVRSKNMCPPISQILASVHEVTGKRLACCS